jgi:agmatine/peptidylarginine deiminase
MPYEQTGHIDIYARFLNDTTVLVAEYTNEQFYLARETVDHQLSCTEQQVRREAWQECASVAVVYPDRGSLRLESAGSGQGLPMTLRWSEMISVLGDLYPDAKFEETVQRYPSGHSHQEHVKKVASAFADYGFRVERIENPTPFLSLEGFDYRDSEGQTVRRIMTVQTVFPTYTNSLMVNGVVYLPQYATASNAQNTQARAPYEKAGFTVVPVDMTQNISFRGATRCLAKEIHGN